MDLSLVALSGWTQDVTEHSFPSSALFCAAASIFLQPSTCIPLSTAPSQDLSSRCGSFVVLFLRGHVTSAGVLARKRCHCALESMWPSQVHFFNAPESGYSHKGINKKSNHHNSISEAKPVAECLEAGAANSIMNLSVILPTSISRPDFATDDSIII